MKKEKILLITKFIPIPAYGGGSKRNIAWLSFLSKKYDVYLIGFWNNNFEKKMLNKYQNIHIFGFNLKRNIFTLFLNIIQSFFYKKPIINFQYFNRKLARKINDLTLNNEFKFVLFSEIATVQYTNYINKYSYIFDDHNVEYELIERMSKYKKFPINILFKRESKLMKNIEYNALNNSLNNFVVSKRDKEIIMKEFSVESHVVNNTYIDKHGNNDNLDKERTILFLGNLSWFPNVHGMKKFINDIYPKIKDTHIDCKFIVIGSNINSEIKKLCKLNNILLYENVDDSTKDDILKKAWLTIVPVYFGGGTRIKIIEYWSNAKVVVSTPIGAEGLPKVNGTFIVQSDEEFANNIIELLNNKNNLKKLGKNNYRIFKKYYEEGIVYENSLYNTIITK